MKFSEELLAQEMEINLLQALCAAGWSSFSGPLKARLGRYSWREPAHQILFDALQHLPAGPAGRAHEHLQAALVRLGFPDIDFDIGASRADKSEEELDQMLQVMESLPHPPARAACQEGRNGGGIHQD